MKTRLFIDFWNFSLQWNKRAPSGTQIDWRNASSVLCSEAATLLSSASLGSLQLEETRVYCGYEPVREAKLRGWLTNFLDKQPGIRVFTSERHWKKRPVHCRECGTETADCPSCAKPFGKASEKKTDSAIVTDLMGLAWDGAYDVAILLSSDRDFVPAVEYLQAKNFKIVNATWQGHGHNLAAKSWASFELDGLIDKLKR